MPLTSLEPIPKNPKEHYQVGKSQNHPLDVSTFFRQNSNDPVAQVTDASHGITTVVLTRVQGFVLKLKDHLLPRIAAIHGSNSGLSNDPDPALTAGLDDAFGALSANTDHVVLKNNRIYRHHVLRINYTTYDVRHANDIFNPSTEHRDIMMLHRPESEQDRDRFCYARIIGIYHANVQYIGPGMKDYMPQQMDFLHVRWFERVPEQDLHGLDALRFIQADDPASFDFVDPTDIVRGCHLIPAFRHGRHHREETAMPPTSIARDEEWKYYYVNRYA